MKEKNLGSLGRYSGKDSFLWPLVMESDARNYKFTVTVFRNQMVTNSGEKLAKAEPPLCLFKLENKVIIDRLVDPHTMTILAPSVDVHGTNDNLLLIVLRSHC